MSQPPSPVTQEAPVAEGERVVALDLVRGVALFGVLVVNLLTGFRVSLARWLLDFHTHPGGLNHAIDLLLGLFLEFKAFALFSMLFGAGMVAQGERAEGAGKRRLRRLGGLFLIGVVHMVLIWDGDILLAYSLCGLLALPLLRLPDGALLSIAGLLLLGQVLVPGSLYPSPAELRAIAEGAQRAYGAGGYAEVFAFRIHEIRAMIAPLVLLCLPRTLGLFLLGALAWRRQLWRDPGAHRALLVGLGAGGGALGLGASLLAAAAAYGFVSVGPFGGLLGLVDAVGLAIGYGVALLFAAGRFPRLLAPFAAAGRMALTHYLTQSLVFGCVFYGYGLGLFGKLAPSSALLLGLLVYGAQVAVSGPWLRAFRFGPVEWAWRCLTYGAWLPLRAARRGPELRARC